MTYVQPAEQLKMEHVGKYLYIGVAASGASVNTNSWIISRATYDSKGTITAIEWADGNETPDNKWSDRKWLTYL